MGDRGWGWDKEKENLCTIIPIPLTLLITVTTTATTTLGGVLPVTPPPPPLRDIHPRNTAILRIRGVWTGTDQGFNRRYYNPTTPCTSRMAVL